MRNSTLPAPTNPYATTTNSDVIVSQSFDADGPGARLLPWRFR